MKTSRISLLTLKAVIGASALIAVDLPTMAQIDVSTGVNSSWNYDTTEWGADGGTGVASIVTPSDADWYGGWIANDSSSSWIAANRNNTAFNNGTYSLSVDLSSYSLSSLALSGSWTIDDDGSLYLNGNLLASLGDGSWGSLSSFSAPNSDFVSGVNTISMVGGSTDNYLEGVRLEGDITGSLNGVPDAGSTFGLLGMAVGALTVLRRKQA